MRVGPVVVGLVVPLADVLVHVALELPAERVLAARTGRRHDVLQRYRLGRGGHGGRLAGAVVAAVDHHHRGRVRPVVLVVPAVQLPVTFAAVRVLPHPALDGHQERADRKQQTADVKEPRVLDRHDGRHDQQEAHRDSRKIKHLWTGKNGR